jgi:hypothetical protein
MPKHQRMFGILAALYLPCIPRGAGISSAPSMGAVLEVKVLSRADHSERSEAQLHEGDRVWEGSVERIRESRYTKRI